MASRSLGASLSNSSTIALVLGLSGAALGSAVGVGCGDSGTGGAGGAGTGTATSTHTTGLTVATVSSNDATSSTGLNPFCGDGMVDAGEDCDTSGVSATCDADCTIPMCGDGQLNMLAGEECDDGNMATGDACGTDCKPTVFALTATLPAAQQLYEQARLIGTASNFLIVQSQIELNGDRTLRHVVYDSKGKVKVQATSLTSGTVSLPVLAADGTGAGRIAWSATDTIVSQAFLSQGGLGALATPVAFPHYAPGSLLALDTGPFCTISLGGDTRCYANGSWGAIHSVSPFSGTLPFSSAILVPTSAGLLSQYGFASDSSERARPLDGVAVPSGAEVTVSPAASNAGPVGSIVHADGTFAVVSVLGSPSLKAAYRAYAADGTPDAANSHDITVSDADLSIAASPNGQFMMAYRTVQQTPPTYTCQVSLQLYTAAGQPSGSPRVVGSPPTNECDRWPRIARSQSGDVMVTWQREVTTSLPSPASFEAIIIPDLLPP